MTVKRLWQWIKCLLGYHGYSGLGYLDTLVPSAAYVVCPGTFVERIEPPPGPFHRHPRYRVWVAFCPYCPKLIPVTDVPIEMREVG